MQDKDPTTLSPSRLNLTKESIGDFQSRYEPVYERDLRPYDSNELLLQRVSGQNRLLRNAPELHDQMQSTFSAHDDESLFELADDIDLARQLYAPEKEKPINTMLSYLTLTQATKDYASTAGPEGIARANVLDTMVSKKITDSFSEQQLPDAEISCGYLQARMARLYEITNQHSLSVYLAKLGNLHGDIRKRYNAYKYIDLFPPDPGAEKVTEQQALKDSEYIAGLFSEVRTTQRYGVKMGYIGDERGGTLVFSPPFDESEYNSKIGAHHLMAKGVSIADVVHSRKARHSKIKQEITEQSKGLSSIDITDLDPVIDMSIGEDGELYTDRDCRTNLRDIAIQKGKYKAYRDLQATVIAHYFDMTHPLAEVMRIQKNSQTASSPAENQNSYLESIERLVVPRARYSRESGDTSAEDSEVTREVRLHNVTWHIRILPEGWHASPAAHELAQKLQVTLADNETIVKAHKRGSALLGEVTGHLLVKQ